MDPFAAARALGGRPGRVALISARPAGGMGQRSLVASDPDRVLRARGGRAELRDGGGALLATASDPFELFGEVVAERGDAAAPLAIGYFGYELGEALVGVAGPPRPAAPEPDLWLARYPAVWQLDHARGEPEIVAVDEAAAAALRRRLETPAPPGEAPLFGELEPLASDADYRRAFERVQRYLEAGDCYQVNLSRRLAAPLLRPGDPLRVLEALCDAKPEPFAALIETGECAVICGSPERFLHRAGGASRLETRPIKGTRRRSGDPARDRAAAAELAASDKERAEHLMIVDLERNDLGRIAVTGSVRVERFAEVVELPALLHMESTVACDVAPGVSTGEVLRATFPGGSITGAPKRRAMEIIRELEPTPRGVYTGAVGALSADGGIDLAIAIRTAVLCDKALSLSVGGGVVVDSTAARELAETEEKALGWRRALQRLARRSC